MRVACVCGNEVNPITLEFISGVDLDRSNRSCLLYSPREIPSASLRAGSSLT
jgi:hypothetical protein